LPASQETKICTFPPSTELRINLNWLGICHEKKKILNEIIAHLRSGGARETPDNDL
jgi:hypothetical protein